MLVTDRKALERKIAAAYELARRQSAGSLGSFLDRVIINAEPTPKRWSLIRDPWQLDLVQPLIPAIEYAVGLRSSYDGPNKFWITLPRGHDKSTLQGRLLNWALAFAPMPVRAVGAAADRGQSRQLVDYMQTEARLNPWLDSRLKFTDKYVRRFVNDSLLTPRSSDAGSAMGGQFNLCVMDEVVFWKSGKLYQALMSGQSKKDRSAYIVITNAGLIGDDPELFWQWHQRELARSQHGLDWYFYESPPGEKLASWISEDRRESDRRACPSASFARRVLDNCWINPYETEDSYLSVAELEACIRPDYRTAEVGTPGVKYYLGGDLGITNDRTVLCVCHREGETVVVDRMEVWAPLPGKPVDLDAVKSRADELVRAFRLRHACFDPNQAKFLIQHLEKRGVQVTHYHFAGQGHKQIADNLKSLALNEKLRLYPGCGRLTLPSGAVEDVVTELSKLIVVETGPHTHRVDHLPGLHDDRYTALALASWSAVKGPGTEPKTTVRRLGVAPVQAPRILRRR